MPASYHPPTHRHAWHEEHVVDWVLILAIVLALTIAGLVIYGMNVPSFDPLNDMFRPIDALANWLGHLRPLPTL